MVSLFWSACVGQSGCFVLIRTGAKGCKNDNTPCEVIALFEYMQYGDHWWLMKKTVFRNGILE